MPARNALLLAPPHPVELALAELGANLRTARLNRNLTVDEVAVSDAERGKPSTSVATYAALLWAFDLLGGLSSLADPARDPEGQALARSQNRVRARREDALDNDF
jgi:hypothetical protein